MAKVRKVCPQHMIAQLMLSGNPVSPESIKEHFANDERMSKVMYRLSIYIGDLRAEGAIVKVQKEGKKVTHYQLANAHLFNDLGQFVGVVKPVETPVEVVSEDVGKEVEASPESVEDVPEVLVVPEVSVEDVATVEA